jgi:hypothetical protein
MPIPPATEPSTAIAKFAAGLVLLAKIYPFARVTLCVRMGKPITQIEPDSTVVGALTECSGIVMLKVAHDKAVTIDYHCVFAHELGSPVVTCARSLI